MIISPSQSRAARALLNMGQRDVADLAGINQSSLSYFESEKKGHNPTANTIKKLARFYSQRGIEFDHRDGVKRKPRVNERTYTGQQGFRDFMDNVYKIAAENGGRIEILNGSPDLFIQHLGEDWYRSHAQRMLAIKEKINFRIITHESQVNLIANSFAEYKRVPSEKFNTQTVYIYGNHIAFFTFPENDEDDELRILELTQAKLVTTFNMLFDLVWEKAT